jgi:hypothetical protein
MAHRSNAEEVRILSRRAKVAALLLRGTTNQFSILAALGMEPNQQSTISRDIKAIREEWKASAVRDFDEAKGRELEKLEAIEADAWAAWERSRSERTITRTRRTEKPGQSPAGKDGKESGALLQSALAESRKEQRDGEQGFLAVALKCVQERCKILGLHAPVRHAHGGDSSAPPVKVERITAEDLFSAQQSAAEYRHERFGGNGTN